jgi:hypothetical protein
VTKITRKKVLVFAGFVIIFYHFVHSGENVSKPFSAKKGKNIVTNEQFFFWYSELKKIYGHKKEKKGKMFRKMKIGQKKCPFFIFPKKSWNFFSLLYNKLKNLLKEPLSPFGKQYLELLKAAFL